MTNSSIFIYGAGSHGSVVHRMAVDSGKEVLGFVDEFTTQSEILEIPVVKLSDVPLDSIMVVAIGENSTREEIVLKINKERPDIVFTSVIHPSAVVLCDICCIGPGTVILPNSTVNMGSQVGKHCIINSSSVLEHHSQMGDFSSLGPNSTTGGNVSIGDRTAICMGAVVKHGVKVGEDNVIGSCSYVHRDIIDTKCVLYGAPAKIVRKRRVNDCFL